MRPRTPAELDALVREVEPALRGDGDVAAADRLRAVLDCAYTTSSEWLGELRRAIADARPLTSSRDALARLDRLAHAVGSRRRPPLVVLAAANVALVLAMVTAPMAVFATALPSALWQLAGAAGAAIVLVLAVWPWLPSGGRAVGVATIALAAVALAQALVRLA